MVEFCCCTLKPRSFYLLMIFIASSFFVYPIIMSAEGFRTTKLFALAVVFAWFLAAAVLYFDILSIVAFFHFVITDQVNSKFPHFYVLNMNWLSLVLAGLQVAFLASFLGTANTNGAQANLLVSLHSCIALILLVFIYFWSCKLKESLPKIKGGAEVEQPIDEESESQKENKVTETAEIKTN